MFGGFEIPFESLVIALLYAFSLSVTRPHIELGRNESLFRSFEIPLGSCAKIFCYPLASCVHNSQIVLCTALLPKSMQLEWN